MVGQSIAHLLEYKVVPLQPNTAAAGRGAQTYHHQVCKLLVPPGPLSDCDPIIGVMRDDVDGDLGGTEILNVGLIGLVDVDEALGPFDGLSSGAQKDIELCLL